MKTVHDKSLTVSLPADEAYQHALTHGFALTDCAIDETRLKRMLGDETAGAMVVFEGWVRNHNNKRAVKNLTYYGYEQLALNQGAQLANEAKAKFGVTHALAVHRVGALEIGDMAVWVGVCSAHRDAAFEACRWLLDAIKEKIPVWKQEFYADDEGGSLWLSNNG
ncbi:Molybdopterin synthase catalytic subunit [Moraxella caviae]|nr:Molybdopterin synthase catalytic subunit [Moraxella caviae]VEW13154.1 Molybdopterin synthase catalytic subunit [Moraxella caviae]